MRNINMEDEQGSYSHKEEIKGLNVSKGNAKKDSNRRRDREELVSIRIRQREV
jgi:hypothetical protein